MTDDELIAQYIADEPTSDPRKRNEPTIKRTGTPVWAVVGYCLRAQKESLEATARDYQLTQDEVRAALVYYQRHPEIDVVREDEWSASVALPR